MKIIYLVPGTSIGGGVNVVLEHASRLSERGHEVTVLSVLGEADTSWNPLYRFTLLSKFNPYHFEYLRGRDIDIVVATGWQTVFELWMLNLSARSFVYFLQADEVMFSAPGSLDRELAQHSREIMFDYMTCASWLKGLAPGGAAEVIVNGVNDEIFFPDTPLVKKGSKRRVLIEGPIAQPRKRIVDAFLACEPFRSRIEVWCVSSGGDAQEWFKPDLFLRRVPMLGMRKVYSACDFIIKLSSAEGMFGPPLEMMACGGTAVTSDCDGHEEYMRDDDNGIVVPVGDIRGAQAAVLRLIDEPETLDRMSKSGKKTAARFSWNGAINKLEAFFSRVSKSAPRVTFRTFAKKRGRILDAGLFRSYYETSYGALMPPTSSQRGAVLVSSQVRKTVTNAVRLRGWVSHDALESAESNIIVEQVGSDPVTYKCTIERPDIYPSSAQMGVKPGFDVVHHLAMPCPSGEKITVRINVARVDVEGNVEHLGQISEAVAGVEGLVTLENDTHVDPQSGLVATLESVKPLHAISVNLLPRDTYKSFSMRVYAVSHGSEAYIFYQPASIGNFLNVGMRLGPSQVGKLQSLSVPVPFDDEVGQRVNLLCEGELTIDCVRLEL